MSDMKYWFGFRAIGAGKPGGAVACGPYATAEEALTERQRAKAPDCQVTIWFVAPSENEAKKEAEWHFSGCMDK